jgi:hypothetical protein
MQTIKGLEIIQQFCVDPARLQLALVRHLSVERRYRAVCGEPLLGRIDSMTCSSRCRLRQYNLPTGGASRCHSDRAQCP